MASRLFGLPNPVNEVSARLVAAGVVLPCAATIAFDQPWLTVTIASGFVARVLSGPTFSPLGQLVTRVITPRLGVSPRFVPGPPKRFAQGIGALFSLSAAALVLGFDLRSAGYAVLGVLACAATLEAAFGVCLECHIFAGLMRLGLIPQAVCQECRDITNRIRADIVA
jgi:hypothetical protein